MSRILASALVLSVFGAGSAYAGSLNIDPFPMEKAGTLSSQGPVVESEDHIKNYVERLERENQLLKMQMEQEQRALEQKEAGDRAFDAIKKEMSAQERAEDLKRPPAIQAGRKASEMEWSASELRARKKLAAQEELPLADEEPQVSDVIEYEVEEIDVDMTPMPGEMALKSTDNFFEAPVQDRTETVAVIPRGPRKIDLAHARIEVLPFNELEIEAGGYPKPAFMTASVGESVEDVLRSWSDSEGVGFLWKTRRQYVVAENVSVDQGYEASVEALLGQFVGGERRPLGTLYTDPVTGVRTLSVVSE